MEKTDHSPFYPWVQKTFPALARSVPPWLSANRISLIGHASSVLAFCSLALSPHSRWFCCAGAFFVFVHLFADMLDGYVARARGVSHLGYYLDHFGDSVSVLLVGIGTFLTPGSHVAIGMLCCLCYLLLFVEELVKSHFTDTMELPAFGPTEMHLFIIAGLLLQAAVDFGRPLGLLALLTGDDGPLTQWLGWQHGFTLVDVLGSLALVIALPFVVVTVLGTIRTARRLDREPAAAASVAPRNPT